MGYVRPTCISRRVLAVLTRVSGTSRSVCSEESFSTDVRLGPSMPFLHGTISPLGPYAIVTLASYTILPLVSYATLTPSVLCFLSPSASSVLRAPYAMSGGDGGSSFVYKGGISKGEGPSGDAVSVASEASTVRAERCRGCPSCVCAMRCPGGTVCYALSRTDAVPMSYRVVSRLLPLSGTNVARMLLPGTSTSEPSATTVLFEWGANMAGGVPAMMGAMAGYGPPNALPYTHVQY
eukprot:3730182-Rhodomonas_salina.2